MLKKWAHSIVDWQIKGGFLHGEERVLYEYAYELLLNQVINILIAACIAILFCDVWTVLTFLLCYIPLRSFAGGYHANTNLGCTLVSACMLCILCLFMKQYTEDWMEPAGLLCFVISGGIIFRYAPVPDKNKPLDDKEKARYRKRSRILWGVEALLGGAAILLKAPWGVVMAVSHIILSVILGIGLIKYYRL